MAARGAVKATVALNGDSSGEAAVVKLGTGCSADECVRIAAKALGKPALGTSVLYRDNGMPLSSTDQVEEGSVLYFDPTGQAFAPPRARQISLDSANGVHFGSPSTIDEDGSGEGDAESEQDRCASHADGWGRAPAAPAPLHRPTKSAVQAGELINALAAQSKRDEPPSLDPVLYETTAPREGVEGAGVPPSGPALRIEAKAVLLGASGVGKSSVMLRLLGRPVVDSLAAPTVGVDNAFRRFSIGPHAAHLMLWDTAGQEKFRSMTRAYFRDAALVIFVFDISSHRSFAAVDRWLHNYRAASTSEGAVMILVANKMDLPASTHQVEVARAEQYAREHGMFFFSVSAKFSQSIDAIFETGLVEVLARVQQGRLDPAQPASGVSWEEGPSGSEGRAGGGVDLAQGRRARSGCCS